MVDPISGSNNSANVGQVGRTQNNKQNDKTSDAEASADVSASDQVELSPEALEAQANDTAREARVFLEQDTGAVLSADAERLNELL
ncbi:MAG: hypothetical protein JKY71_10395 [Alphaproteobacteria bacterium]|nr:hypothetical protein [Alphaproteobacteria bacterium]